MSASAITPAADLAALLEDEIGSALKTSGPLFRAACYAIEGGRRLRGRLLLDTCGSLAARALRPAATLELLHGATLIQDDMLDTGHRRHGRPCTHRAFGPGRALLASDWLLMRALAMANAFDSRFGQAMNEAVQAMILAEADDLDPEPAASGPVLQIPAAEAILETARGKTGGLFGLALYGAALVRGLSPRPAAAARSLGVELGATFQLTDDALDVYASEERAGKDVRHDVAAGRLTMPLLFAAESMDHGGRSRQDLRRRLAQAAPEERAALLAVAHTPAVRRRLGDLLRQRIAAHRRDAQALPMLPELEPSLLRLFPPLEPLPSDR